MGDEDGCVIAAGKDENTLRVIFMEDCGQFWLTALKT